MILPIYSISPVRPAVIMKKVRVHPILMFWLLFAAYFHVTLDQLILHDLKAEGFTADSDPSSVMMESKTPYMQGIEKNTGNYIYLTEEELNLILAFRSSSDEQRKIVTGFLNSDK